MAYILHRLREIKKALCVFANNVILHLLHTNSYLQTETYLVPTAKRAVGHFTRVSSSSGLFRKHHVLPTRTQAAKEIAVRHWHMLHLCY